MYISQNNYDAAYFISGKWLSQKDNILLQITQLNIDHLKFEVGNENPFINQQAIQIRKRFDNISMKITYNGNNK